MLNERLDLKTICGTREGCVIACRFIRASEIFSISTKPIVICRLWIEVQCIRVGATGFLKSVTYAIAIGVSQTISVTCKPVFSKCAIGI